jgi:hypothetical protein
MNIKIEGLKMTHYTYIITNTINNMKYIGVRSCKGEYCEDTLYMGSSKRVAEAIEELGADKFKKELLATFSTRAEAELDEMNRLIEVDARNNEKYYNLVNGAEGFTTQGLTKENSKLMRENSERNKLDWEMNREAKIAKIHHQDRDYSNHEISLSRSRGKGKSRLTGDARTEAQKIASEKYAENLRENNHLVTPEAIAKRVKTITGRSRPDHSEAMSGRTKINKDGEYKVVKADELDNYLQDGWVVGGRTGVKKVQIERECPHCGKQGKGPNMSRYHFDNCKHKE